MTRIRTKLSRFLQHSPPCQDASAGDDGAQGTCAICSELRRGRFPTAYGFVCPRCYRGVLISLVCSHCHRRKVRTKREDAAPCCAVCRYRNLVATSACARCGVALKHVEQWTQQGPICAKCYQRERPALRCGHCWMHSSTVRVHSKYGEGRPICHRCVYKRLPKCSECKGRFRPVSGAGESTICQKCLSGRIRKVRCACGAWTRQFGHKAARCVNCTLKAKVIPKTRDRLLKGLHQTWVKELFSEYCNMLCRQRRWATPIPAMLRTDFDIFSGIDRAFTSQSQLSESALAAALGPVLFRHRTRLLRWMVSRKLIGSLCPIDREWALLPWRIRALSDEHTPAWIVKTIDSFHKDIVNERDRFVRKNHKRTRAPLRAHSALQNLRSARSFLLVVENWGINEVTAIQQEHVDRYSSIRRPQNSLCRFFRFLNQRTSRFSPLRLHGARQISRLARPLTTEEFDELLTRMLRPNTHIELRYMLITLFCLLYAQYPKSAVALRQEQVREDSGRWEFRPAKIWLSVPDSMGALLTQWQSSRREQSIMDTTGSSPFLFPGERALAWVSTGSLNGWLAERGVRSNRLFVSGFANLCRHGLAFASVARDAYGVNPATAVRYLAEFHPARTGIAAREVRASTVKRKQRRSK